VALLATATATRGATVAYQFNRSLATDVLGLRTVDCPFVDANPQTLFWSVVIHVMALYTKTLRMRMQQSTA